MIKIKHVTAQKRQRPRWIPGQLLPSGNRSRGHMSSTQREYDAKPRLYVSIDAENMLENFAYRWDRPAREYRKLLPAIFEALQLPADTKASWSQKAGCSCGCSPGFVLDIPRCLRRNLTDRTPRHIDFWVTVEGDDAKVAEKPNLERLAIRGQRGVEVFVEGRL